MPELPEVETVANGLSNQLLNKTIHNVDVHLKRMVHGFVAPFKKALINHAITNITRHGKYLFLNLENEKTVVVHLRMTGQLFFAPIDREKDKHTHLEFYFDDLNEKLIYRDIRTFGRFTLIKSSDFDSYIADKKLGGDALTISKKEFAGSLRKKKISLKGALLDQSVIAGVGNIYADEILHKEKLSPVTSPISLSDEQITSLLKSVKSILKKAVLRKGTTFSDYVNSYGEKGKFQLSLKVYNRQGLPCKNCKTPIVKTKVAGRGTYICPSCQR